MKKLREYQRYLVNKIKEKNRVLLAVDMGLGKTASCLFAVKELTDINKILIVAPLRVAQTTWPDEIEDWPEFKELTYTVIKGKTPAQRLKCLEKNTKIYIINKENINWLLENAKINFDMIIWDESSSLKNAKKKTPTGNLTRWGACLEFSKKAKRVVLLSGTPTPNGLMDLYGQIGILDFGERLGKKTHFIEEYFNNISRFNYPIYVARNGSYEKVMEKVHDLMVKMKSSDYITLPDFMPIEEKITIDLTEYKELQKTMVLGDVIAANKAVLINKLLQLSSGCVYNEDGSYKIYHEEKISKLKELVEENDENILLFYNFKHEKEQLQKHFKDIVFLKDEKQLKDWNDGKIKLLACHPQSAGHGLNLQHGGSVMVWLSLPWSLELYQQANKRLHRSGQQKPVRCYHFICKNTVDEYVYKVLNEKDATQEKILNLVDFFNKNA